MRARLAVLSEIPEQWSAAVRRWAALNREYWRAGPDRNIEYLLYQTLAGAWPISTERVWGYINKAVREAKLKTSWTKPDEEYEQTLQAFVEGALSNRTFIAELEEFVASLLPCGRVNSLAQTLLKLTALGIPDIYQGTELWDFSLVDPDNRRPVDYQARHRLLRIVKCATVEEVMKRAGEGLPKLWVIHRTLVLRQARPELFGPKADYSPLTAEGSRAGHVVAFIRGGGAVTVAPRLVFGLASRWENTTLEIPPGRWRNELSGDQVEGGRVALTALTARFPVCLLVSEDSRP